MPNHPAFTKLAQLHADVENFFTRNLDDLQPDDPEIEDILDQVQSEITAAMALIQTDPRLREPS